MGKQAWHPSAPGDSAWVWGWAESWAWLRLLLELGQEPQLPQPGGLGGALNWVHSAQHSWCGLRGGGAAVAPDTFASECDDKLPFPISTDPSASKTVGPNEHTVQQL